MYAKTKDSLMLFFPKTVIFDPSQKRKAKAFVIKASFSWIEHQTVAS